MAPSGGATIEVDHAITWSPEKIRSASLSANAMWLAVWPGVVTASMVQPSPVTTSPSASATSGRKSMSAEASSRSASPICSGRAGAVRALGVNRRAGRRLDLGHGRRMIAVGMGDENVGDGFAAHGVEQRGDMGVVVRPGIDDRDLAAADDVAHRALEGERAGIVGDDARARPAPPPSARPGTRSNVLL